MFPANLCFWLVFLCTFPIKLPGTLAITALVSLGGAGLREPADRLCKEQDRIGNDRGREALQNRKHLCARCELVRLARAAAV